MGVRNRIVRGARRVFKAVRGAVFYIVLFFLSYLVYMRIYTIVWVEKVFTPYEFASLILVSVIVGSTIESLLFRRRLYDPFLVIHHVKKTDHIIIPNQGEIPISILGITAVVKGEEIPLGVHKVEVVEGKSVARGIPIPFVIRPKDYVTCKLLMDPLRQRARERADVRELKELDLRFDYKTIREETQVHKHPFELWEEWWIR